MSHIRRHGAPSTTAQTAGFEPRAVSRLTDFGPLILAQFVLTPFMLVLFSPSPVFAQGSVNEMPPGEMESITPLEPAESISAPRAVREGNERLLAGDPAGALEAYARARLAQPHAPEIDFVEGLAHYRLDELEKSRRLFESAASAADDTLVDDAIYSVGTTYHKQALSPELEPQARIVALEEAMKRYRTVLEHQPEHEAARESNYKAATMWRSLRQQQQQQQQQESDENNDENNDEQDDENQQQQQQQQDQQDQPQQDQQQQDQQQQDQQQQQQQDSEPQDEKQEEQQASSSESKEEQQKEQQAREEQARAEEKEDISREQAERQLREMMQALRDRKKMKREKVEPVRIVPVEKDW